MHRANIVSASERHLLPRAVPASRRIVAASTLEDIFIDLAHRQNSFSKAFLRVKLRGPRIVKADVEQAVAALQRRHPILRTRPIRHGKSFALEECPSVRIPVLERAFEGEDGWRAVHRSESEHRALQLDQDPNRVYLLQPPPSQAANGRQDVVFDFQHYTADGASMPHFVHEFLQVLSGDKPHASVRDGAWPVANCHSLEATLQGMPLLERLHARYVQPAITLNAQALRGVTLPPPFGAIRFPVAVKQPPQDVAFVNSVHAARATLESADLDALLRVAKSHGASLTTVVAATMAGAVADALAKNAGLGSSKFRVGLSIVGDARAVVRPAIDPTDLSVHASAGVLVATPRRAWGLAATQHEALELARTFKSQVSSKSDMLAMARVNLRFMRMLPLPESMPAPTVVVSSWNAKSPIADAYGLLAVDDIDVIQAGSGLVPPTLSVFRTQHGKLGLSFMAAAPRFDTGLIDTIGALTAERLRGLARSSSHS